MKLNHLLHNHNVINREIKKSKKGHGRDKEKGKQYVYLYLIIASVLNRYVNM